MMLQIIADIIPRICK